MCRYEVKWTDAGGFQLESVHVKYKILFSTQDDFGRQSGCMCCFYVLWITLFHVAKPLNKMMSSFFMITHLEVGSIPCVIHLITLVLLALYLSSTILTGLFCVLVQHLCGSRGWFDMEVFAMWWNLVSEMWLVANCAWLFCAIPNLIC